LSAITPDATLAGYRSADTRPGTQPATGPGGISTATWIRIGTIALLLCAIFWPNLRRLWFKTNPFWSTHPDANNWQHAIFVPLIGIYYLYANREQLLAAPVRSRRLGGGRGENKMRTLGWMFALTWLLPAAVILALGLHRSFFGTQLFLAITILFANFVASLFIPSFQLGLLILLQGLAVSTYGIYPGQNDLIWDFGMVVTLFGVVLLLTGWDVMKIAWFPIIFLICALPWPGLVYSWVAGPLQTLAARAAVGTLRFTGVDIFRSGTKMIMLVPNELTGRDETRILNVAEACAGLRSLMTFVTLAAAVGFLSARPLWQKIVITVSAIPIAIFCNVFRVTGQGLIDRYWSQEYAEGFAHNFVGLVMMVPAFLMILMVCWLLDHLFLDVVDEQERERVRMGGGRGVEKKVIQIQRPGIAPAPAVAGAAPPPPRPATTPPRPGSFPRPAGSVGTPKSAAHPAQAPAGKPAAPKGPVAKPHVGPAAPSNSTAPVKPVQPPARPQAKPPQGGGEQQQ
jgi:exosortase